MNDQDYLRKGAKLAGWTTTRLGNQRIVVFIPTPDDVTHVLRIGYLDEQHVKDALAAQLVRQVDAVHHYTVVTYIEQTTVEDWAGNGEVIVSVRGFDRTMNTIKAIVDSKVLEGEQNASS